LALLVAFDLGELLGDVELASQDARYRAKDESIHVFAIPGAG
jgi:hypothetical protein